MMRSRLLTIVTVIGLAAPITGIAQSYMSPEDVLQQNDGAFLIPSRSRGSQWRADFEAQLSRERHPSILKEPWDVVQDEGIPPPIADEEFIDESLRPVDTMPTYGGLDPMTARLLARLAQQNSLLTSTLQSTAGANGAPLAGTGPASILAVLAMGAATLWTLRKARMLGRFV